jgi:hypothetical protein
VGSSSDVRAGVVSSGVSSDNNGRRWRVDGLDGPMDGLGGPIHGFFRLFLLFYLINRGGHLNRLGKDLIYLDI